MAGLNLTGRGKWLAISAVVLVVAAGIIAGWAAAARDEAIDLDRIIADIEAANFDRALADLDRAEEAFDGDGLNQQLAWVHGERGYVYLQQGEYELGVAALDRAIELDPAQPSFYNNRALNFERLGRAQDAESDFTSAIVLDPTNYLPYVERGFFYLANGANEQALSDADAAITLAPGQPIALTLRSDANSRLGNYEDALADLDRIVALVPDEWGPLVSRAVVKNHLGQTASALTDLRTALALNPPPDGRDLIDATRSAILSEPG